MSGEKHELLKDLEELKELAKGATRMRVKDILSVEIRKLESKLVQLREMVAGSSNEAVTVKSVTSTFKTYDVKITDYAWDQSDKFVKIFLTIKGVHTLDASKVTCRFDTKSMEMSATELENRNYKFTIVNLLKPIDPSRSHWKVKTDMVTIFMKKVDESSKWPSLTASRKQAEDEEPKIESEPDSNNFNDAMMGLMKKLYTEGDDETKRYIAKAWSEGMSNKTNLEF